jgi:hypothetical protein
MSAIHRLKYTRFDAGLAGLEGFANNGRVICFVDRFAIIGLATNFRGCQSG